MKILSEILRQGIEELQKNGIKDARRSAEDLLAHLLNISRMDLYLPTNVSLTEEKILAYHLLIERRKKKEPIGYLCGNIPFYQVEIDVDPRVLIPRQETELLVDKVVEILKKQDLEGKLLVDLCCGSGCIGISLKKRFPQLTVILSDISSDALDVAKKNAKKNGVEADFHLGDLLEGLEKTIDFLTCNPPYVAEEEIEFLEEEVKMYEPKIALLAREGGVEFYRKLASLLPRVLSPKAKLFFEMGEQQKEKIKKIFCSSSWSSLQFFSDWAGKDRFFFLEKE